MKLTVIVCRVESRTADRRVDCCHVNVCLCVDSPVKRNHCLLTTVGQFCLTALIVLLRSRCLKFASISFCCSLPRLLIYLLTDCAATVEAVDRLCHSQYTSSSEIIFAGEVIMQSYSTEAGRDPIWTSLDPFRCTSIFG